MPKVLCKLFLKTVSLNSKASSKTNSKHIIVFEVLKAWEEEKPRWPKMIVCDRPQEQVINNELGTLNSDLV